MDHIVVPTDHRQVYNTHIDGYSESAALQFLLRAAHNALEADLERIEKNDDYTTDQFTISVGGVTCAFLLGGPQYDALISFVEHIAGENLYTVNLDNLTVEGW